MVEDKSDRSSESGYASAMFRYQTNFLTSVMEYNAKMFFAAWETMNAYHAFFLGYSAGYTGSVKAAMKKLDESAKRD